MNHFKLTEYTHPAEIFKHQADLQANREWAQRLEVTKLPTYQHTKVEKKKAWGLLMALRSAVLEMKP